MKIDFRQLKEIIDSKNTRLINQMAEEISLYSQEKDKDKIVIELYEISANLGNSEAMEKLGNAYETGSYGIDIDYIKAKEWYEKAAVLGNVNSIADLSIIYGNGLGVEPNNDIANLLKDRIIGSDNWSYELVIANAMCEHWDDEALCLKYELDDLDKIQDKCSLLRLASMYENGRKVEKDISKAIKIYENLVDANIPYAILCLASIYENGKGVEVDYQKAKELYEKAANLNNSIAMERLASMYEEGRGVEVDYSMAINWYNKAGELGNSNALVKLASMYKQEKGVVRDDTIIINLYKKAIDLGNPDAMLYLRDLYEKYMNGTLTNPFIYNSRVHPPFNTDKLYQNAKEKYQKLADLGNIDALAKLFKLTYIETKKLYDRVVSLGVSDSILNVGELKFDDNTETFLNPKKR